MGAFHRPTAIYVATFAVGALMMFLSLSNEQSLRQSSTVKAYPSLRSPDVVDSLVSTSPAIVVVADRPVVTAETKTQQLHVDLSNVAITTEEKLHQVTTEIAGIFGLNLLTTQVVRFGQQNPSFTLVATLAEIGHVTLHTCAETQTLVLDVLCTGTTGTSMDEKVPKIVELFGSTMESTTFSVLDRSHTTAFHKDHINSGTELDVVLATHKPKQKLLDIKSKSKHIQVWEQQERNSLSSFNGSKQRMLFVDGSLHTSLEDDVQYHESFVHPAFVASSLPPKRILVLGGADGGIIREALKWQSVETVDVIHQDEDLVAAFRKFLPTLSNCTGFGTSNCFDDPRVNLVNQQFNSWFQATFGQDICKQRNSAKHLLYDVILVDCRFLKGIHEEGTELVERLACALQKFGVLSLSVGKAPSIADLSFRRDGIPHYKERLDLMQRMSSFFFHERVYDTYLGSVGSMWAFAVGIVPRRVETQKIQDDNDLLMGVYNGSTNGGVNDFDGRPARVNLKLRRGLLNGASLGCYDGALQNGFLYPRAAWKQLFCSDVQNKLICGVEHIFSNDYEDQLFEYKVDKVGGGGSGVVAKRDIKQGTVTGLFDAATDLQLPGTDYQMLLQVAKGKETPFHRFEKWIDKYGYDRSTGDMIYTSLSYLTFANHACDGNPNLGDLPDVYPWSQEVFYRWDPVSSRIIVELDHLQIATRDIAQGEMITCNYGNFAGFVGCSEDDPVCADGWLEGMCGE